jgi:hypothetical protein
MSFAKASVFVGDATPALIYFDEMNKLWITDASGDRELGTFASRITALAASPDRKRVAVANNKSVTILDERGTKILDFATAAFVQAFAWSPDLRTLAVSTRTGVELWTIPR